MMQRRLKDKVVELVSTKHELITKKTVLKQKTHEHGRSELRLRANGIRSVGSRSCAT